MSTPMWRPSAQRREQANATRFINRLQASQAPGVRDWNSLYEWSTEQPQAFWSFVWEFFDVVGERGSATVEYWLDMPGPRWFPEARLNFAEYLLRHRDDRAALICAGERGVARRISYAELYTKVARVAHALRAMGAEKGDRVAGYLPSLPETVIAMLAATSIGAVWSSCSL